MSQQTIASLRERRRRTSPALNDAEKAPSRPPIKAIELTYCYARPFAAAHAILTQRRSPARSRRVPRTRRGKISPCRLPANSAADSTNAHSRPHKKNKNLSVMDCHPKKLPLFDNRGAKRRAWSQWIFENLRKSACGWRIESNQSRTSPCCLAWRKYGFESPTKGRKYVV